MAANLPLKTAHGRTYRAPEANQVINKARMNAGYDATKLAMMVGLDRVKLNLIIGGQDPVPGALLDKLKEFVARHG
jgi:hypothetical protein